MSQLTRRDFVQASSALAAAVATSSGAITAAAPEKKSNPGEKLRVAVIGVNGRGMDHVRGYLDQSGSTVVAICDADESVIGKAMKPKC